MVPEPELTLVINRAGRVVGYAVGNDLSARDIEGDNPLYLPQAKVWDRSAAIGPGWLLTDDALPPETQIALEIVRGGAVVQTGRTSLAQMRRRPDELVAYLWRETSFPVGCLLMTGTGIVPADDFTLAAGDVVRITIEPIGTLVNVMTIGDEAR
jgi:2-dehydro-3-deoxy-D-arabinonate dehydratase